MKKHRPTIAIALAVVLLLSVTGAALAAGGTQADPLISLSYLTGAFWDSLTEAVRERVSKATQATYDAYAAPYAGESDPRWSQAGQFTAQGGERADTVTLDVGAGLLWVSGRSSASSPLVDVTAGAVLPAGEGLTPGHRYLAEAETVVTVDSRTAHWMVEGRYTTTSDGISVTELPFTDVSEEQWFFENVLYVYENGLMVGTEDTLFSPDLTASRAMVVTILWRLEGSPQAEAAPFTDLSQDWYAAPVGWAAANGVVNGYDDGTFGPDDPVTREQLTTILYRYAALKGKDVSGAADLSIFSDRDAISEWAGQAMAWASSTGILLGADGAAMPKDNATRAQLAAVLQRLRTWLDQAPPAPQPEPEPAQPDEPSPEPISSEEPSPEPAPSDEPSEEGGESELTPEP